MLFTHHIDALLNRYIADPAAITIADIIPLIDYLAQQTIDIPNHIKPQLQNKEEGTVADKIPATMLIQGNDTARASPTSPQSKKAAIITIGVHGNEIYAGAICALEILKTQKQGCLAGDIILQLGNIKAIKGYLDSYDPKIDYTARAGWRCTYGKELTARTISLADGSAIDVQDDLNRTPKNVMSLPRGAHPNIDRAQEIIWTARALEQGLLPDAHGVLRAAAHKRDIGFILHPHTSRSPNGITNLSLPAKSREGLKNGAFGKPFIHTPPYMMNIVHWLGTGLGGDDNYTMTRLLSEEMATLPLVITAELGNHENIKTPCGPSLMTTAQHFTAGLLESRGLGAPSFLKNAYNFSANKHQFKYYEAQLGRMQLRYLDGFSQIKNGDVIYPVRQMDDTERDTLSLRNIAAKIILIDDQGHAEIFDATLAQQNQARIKAAHSAYYQAFPFELEEIKGGETLFLSIKKDGTALSLKAQHDFHAIFPWPMQSFFPLTFDPALHGDMKIYNTSTSMREITLPAPQSSAHNSKPPAPQNTPRP